jgi:hypothetical protein
LPDEPYARGSQGRAHTYLASAQRRASEQQAGDVDARQQQHQLHRAEQHQQHGLGRAYDLIA